MPASRTLFGFIPMYPLLIVTGVLCALFLSSKEEKRLSLPRDTAIDLVLAALPAGIVGARLYYVVFAWELYRDNPLSVLYIWEGGLAIYGGIIGGIIAVLLCARRKKLPFPLLLDLIIIGVPFAQAIGRWGNFFNMEAYGRAVSVPALCFFPLCVFIPADGTWHMATFFYESCWDLLVFCCLWCFRKKKKRRGDLFLWYVLLYGAGRCLIEGLRTDSLMMGSLRVSQLLSLLACLAVLAVFLLRAARNGHPRLLLLALPALLPAVFPFTCVAYPLLGVLPYRYNMEEPI